MSSPKNERKVELLITHYEKEIYTHRLLWIVAQREAGLADAKEEGSFYHNLVALVFASLTVEGYVNWAGERVDPEAWKDERKYFSKLPYRGAIGKLKKISEVVSVPWEPETEPLKTILKLKELRDLIAHAKPEKDEGTVEHPADTEYDHLTGDLFSTLVSKSSRIAGMQAVEHFVDRLHSAARNRFPYDPYFTFDPLRGPISEGGWVTGAKE
jgi:hypothetical protein